MPSIQRSHRTIEPVPIAGNILRELRSQSDRFTLQEVKDIAGFYTTALDKRNSFPKRVMAFLSAESASGRRAKIVKDFVLLFLPYGEQIGSATQMLREVVIPEDNVRTNIQTNTGDMKQIKWLKNRLHEKSTKAAIVILVSFLAFFGFQLDVVTVTATLDGILAAASGLIGAAALLYEMFRRERTDSEHNRGSHG